MSTSLETKTTEHGIVCSFPDDLMKPGAKVKHEMAGKAFGLIKYVLPQTQFSMWEASPSAQLPAQIFMSLEAAEFYMVAAAAEYLAVIA